MTALAPVPRLTSPAIRERNSLRSPVEKTKVVSPLVPDLATTVTTTETIELNGLMALLITAAPDIPTDSDFTVALLDSIGTAVYTSGNIADNGSVATSMIASNLYLQGQFTIKITFTTALSGDTALFDVRFYVVTP